MDNKKRLLSLIGLATRARKVVSGEFSTEKSVKSGRSCVLTIRFRFICSVRRRNLVMPWDRSFGLRCLWRMPGSQSRWQGY